jgi:hypothetical protein
LLTSIKSRRKITLLRPRFEELVEKRKKLCQFATASKNPSVRKGLIQV